MGAPGGDGVVMLYVTIVLLTISWIVVVARLTVRKWKDLLGLDDGLMFAGMILYTVTASLVIVCAFHGSGQLSKALSAHDIMVGTKLFFIAEFFYASCTVPIKCSICVTLLRIADARRRFVWTLWGLMGTVTVASVIFMLVIANICHPITTLWGETTYGTCNISLNSSVSFFFSAISILSDWTLAILPGILVWKIQMKTRVKFSVTVILGLAAFASCATIVRLRYLTLYNDQSEFMFSTGKIGLWSVLEEGIGIIAGSMPALRPLLNIPCLTHNSSVDGASGKPSTRGHDPGHLLGAYGGQQSASGVHLDSFRSPSALESDDSKKNRARGSEDDDGDSQKHILKETRVTQTVGAESATAVEDWARQRVLGWTNNKY